MVLREPGLQGIPFSVERSHVAGNSQEERAGDQRKQGHRGPNGFQLVPEVSNPLSASGRNQQTYSILGQKTICLGFVSHYSTYHSYSTLTLEYKSATDNM